MGTDSEILRRDVAYRMQLLWRTTLILLVLASAFLSIFRSGDASDGHEGASATVQTIVATDAAPMGIATSVSIRSDVGDGGRRHGSSG